MTGRFIDRLRAAGAREWAEYTEHEFVRLLGAGTLPAAAFRDYLVQDYLFLAQFARASALAAYKSRTLGEIEAAAGALAAILEETRLHRRLAARWGLGGAELDATPERLGTVAYTRYVLDIGMSGGLLELHVALAPCTIGYAEIGAALAPLRQAEADHPYGEWIDEYAGDAFQAAARDTAERLDRLAGELPDDRVEELAVIFRTASRLEAGFWQQALDAAAQQTG